MASDQVRMSRRVAVAALRDAIDWQASFMEAHDPTAMSVQSCCKPGRRCEAYRDAAKRAESYRRTLARLGLPN